MSFLPSMMLEFDPPIKRIIAIILDVMALGHI